MLLGSELSRQKNCTFREILWIKTTKLILIVFKCSNREILPWVILRELFAGKVISGSRFCWELTLISILLLLYKQNALVTND